MDIPPFRNRERYSIINEKRESVLDVVWYITAVFVYSVH